MNSIGLLVVFSLVSLVISRSGCVLQNDSIPYWRESQARLKSHVLSHRVVREKLCPVNRNHTVQLSFYFYCYQVLIGEDVEQSFTSYNYLKITWTDPELTWDPTHYGDYSGTKIPYDDMWHPEVMVANSADKDFMMVRPLNNHLLVYHDGLVKLETPAFLKTTCPLDLKSYPFDIQECEISFLPYVEDCKYEILEATEEVIPDPFNLQGEWTILTRDIWNTLYGGNNSNVKVKLRMRRNSVFYVVTILGPLVVTSTMTSFVFCIPPGSGERVSFLVTIFVSNAVFLNFISGTVPRSFTLSNMPRLAIYLCGIIMESFLALLATMCVLWKYNKEQQEVINITESTHEQKTTRTNVDYNQLQNITLEQNNSSNDLTAINNQSSTDVFRKVLLFFLNLRLENASAVNPVKKPVKFYREKHDVVTVRRKCHVTSRDLDVIFFILYHVISVPFYVLLFAFE